MMMLTEDEAFLGSDREAWLCGRITLKFGDGFFNSSLYGWVEIKYKVTYHFGKMPYMLLLSANIFWFQSLELIGKDFEQVTSLEKVVIGGAKVAEKQFVVLFKLLIRNFYSWMVQKLKEKVKCKGNLKWGGCMS